MNGRTYPRAIFALIALCGGLGACDIEDGAGWYIDVALANGDGGSLTSYDSGHYFLCMENIQDAIHVGEEIYSVGAWRGRVWYAPCGQTRGDTAYGIKLPLNLDESYSVGKWFVGVDPNREDRWVWSNAQQAYGVTNALCYLLTRGRLKAVQQISAAYYDGHDTTTPGDAGCTATPIIN